MKLKYLAALLLGFAVFFTACDDEDYTIAKGEVVTEVTTGGATTTAVSAVLTGTVKDLSSLSSSSYTVGAYYGTDPDPINSGSRQTGSADEDGNITVTVTGLSTGETYYYAIYVTLQGYVSYYGDVKSFVASDVNVTTVDVTNVSACKATFGCTATGTDGVDVTLGVKLSATSDAAAGREFEVGEVCGLLPATTYYYAGYALVDGTYIYGDTKSFTTSSQTMEYVDLGLSVQWAKWNIGAEAESEVGALVGYGEPTGLVTSTSLANYASYDISGT
ncbi:MAG: hypothetical protein LUD72_12535, partial [Bacteroidales bacterium]|nr:hypothetical protein [Bacteroidales bacterium]